MALSKTSQQALTELFALARIRTRRGARLPESAALIARLVASAHTTAVDERGGGVAFRLEGPTEGGGPRFVLTCVLHRPGATADLTTAEAGIAALLCEGHTLAQIASLRGVSANTVKSQVRQIFRKLDVSSRVALVRRLCP